MFEKIEIEFEGETVSLHCRRMPHTETGRLFDRLIKTRTDGIPSTEVLAENRCKFICDTYVDETGKKLFTPGYPKDEGTWGDESVLRQYPLMWSLGKFIAYSRAAEKFQSPKLEDVAKNSTATTNEDFSSASP